MTATGTGSRAGEILSGSIPRRAATAVALAIGLLVILRGVGNRVAASDAPLAYGVVTLGLGLAVAVFYGLWRNTRVGVLVWIVAALFSVSYADMGLKDVERLAFAALAAGWFIQVVTGTQTLKRFGLTEAALVLFLLVHVISAVAPHSLPETASLPAQTLIIDGVFLPLAAYVIGRQALADTRSIRALMWFLVWLGLYMAVICLMQRFGGRSLVFPRQIVDASLGVNPERSRGPLLNSAADGIIMDFSLAAALFMGQLREVRHRWIALVTAVLLPLGIFTTQTRAIYLGAAVVVLGGVMFARGYRRWYAYLLAAAVAVIAVNYQTFLSSDRTQGGVTSAGEVESRLNDWATAIWAFEHKPAFGWGIARFPEVNTTYHQAWPGVDWQLGWGYLSHNTHLAFAAELGMVGVLIWVAVLGSIVGRSVAAWRKLPSRGLVSRGLVLAFWFSFVAWLLNAAVIDVRLFIAINAIIFTWAGMLAGLADCSREELEAMNEPPTARRRERVGIPPELLRPAEAAGRPR